MQNIVPTIPVKVVKRLGGVYVIMNTVNGKFYVGSTNCFKTRWKDHRNLMKSGSHSNEHLVHAWRKYGEEAFEFAVIEIVKEDHALRDREQYWIDLLKPYIRGIGYNKAKDAARSTKGARLKPRRKYKGIYFDKRRETWGVTFIPGNTKPVLIAGFRTDEEAAKVYDSLMSWYFKDSTTDLVYINFPEDVKPMSIEVIRKQIQQRKKQQTTSKFLGVSWSKGRKKWAARIEVNDVFHWLGHHDSEKDAAETYDAVALYLLGKDAKLNFNGKIPPKSPEQAKKDVQVKNLANRGKKFLGVSECVSRSGITNSETLVRWWRGKYAHRRTMFYTKRFRTPEEAAIARDKLAIAHGGENVRLNFPHLKAMYLDSTIDQHLNHGVQLTFAF